MGEMEKNHRISIVIGGMNRAGAETFVMNFIQSQSVESERIDLVVFSNEMWDYNEDINEVGSRLITIPQRGILRLMFLYKYFKMSPVKVVHSHVLWYSGLVLFIAFLAGIQGRIAHSHNTEDSGSRGQFVHGLYRTIMKKLIVYFSSDNMACGSAAGVYMFGTKPFLVVPNGISAHKFRPSMKTVSGGGPLKIISIGRLENVKNHDFLIDAVSRLNRPFILNIYGQGSLYDSLKLKVESLNLQTKISLMGTSESIHEVMRESDLLVMPSLHEGFPVTLIEAQFSNLVSFVSSKVSNEVDLGLGLIKFLPLDADIWTSELEDYKPDCSKKITEEYIASSQFSSENSAQLVLNCYKNYV